jgi:hypothetical protein
MASWIGSRILQFLQAIGPELPFHYRTSRLFRFMIDPLSEPSHATPESQSLAEADGIGSGSLLGNASLGLVAQVKASLQRLPAID